MKVTHVGDDKFVVTISPINQSFEFKVQLNAGACLHLLDELIEALVAQSSEAECPHCNAPVAEPHAKDCLLVETLRSNLAELRTR